MIVDDIFYSRNDRVRLPTSDLHFFRNGRRAVQERNDSAAVVAKGRMGKQSLHKESRFDCDKATTANQLNDQKDTNLLTRVFFSNKTGREK